MEGEDKMVWMNNLNFSVKFLYAALELGAAVPFLRRQFNSGFDWIQ
uniref:Uncharacterized protein n=1 Tax=Vitis vinifera TaxID=29760 RepID=F6H3L7_VITVI